MDRIGERHGEGEGRCPCGCLQPQAVLRVSLVKGSVVLPEDACQARFLRSGDAG